MSNFTPIEAGRSCGVYVEIQRIESGPVEVFDTIENVVDGEMIHEPTSQEPKEMTLVNSVSYAIGCRACNQLCNVPAREIPMNHHIDPNTDMTAYELELAGNIIDFEGLRSVAFNCKSKVRLYRFTL